MKKFLKNLISALIPIIAINVLCWGVLVFLAWQVDLAYVNYASALDKEKRLETLEDQSRLVIIGGSNARFGFDCSILRDRLHLEPVNMGIHIGLGLDYMFEQVDGYLQKGDVLLISAEYNHFLSVDTYYGDEGLTDMYLIKHEWGKALAHMVDTHNYFSMYRLARRRIKRINMSMTDIPENMEIRTKYNEFGDYTGHYGLPSPGHWGMEPLALSPDKRVLENLKEKVVTLRERGIRIIFLPPPYSHSSFCIDSLAISNISGSLKSIDVSFHINPCECVYPDSLFYDSRYHLTREGLILHSQRIADKLKETL